MTVSEDRSMMNTMENSAFTLNCKKEKYLQGKYGESPPVYYYFIIKNINVTDKK